MKKYVHSNWGFTLPAILASAAALTFTMVAGLRYFQASSTAQRGLALDSEFNDLVYGASLILRNQNSCTQAFVGQRFEPNPNNAPLEVSQLLAGTSVVAQVGSPAIGMKIDTMRVIPVSDLGPVGPERRYLASFEIRATKSVGPNKFPGGNQKRQLLTMDVYVNPADNRIVRCSGGVALPSANPNIVTDDPAEAACFSHGGTYDLNANPPCLFTQLGISDTFADRDAKLLPLITDFLGGLYLRGGMRINKPVPFGDTVVITNSNTSASWPKNSNLVMVAPNAPGRSAPVLRLGAIQYDPAVPSHNVDGNEWTIVSVTNNVGELQFNCDPPCYDPGTGTIMTLNPQGVTIGGVHKLNGNTVRSDLTVSHDANVSNDLNVTRDAHISGRLFVGAGEVVPNSPSDERLKENIDTLTDALKTLGKIRGVQFTWRKNKHLRASPEVREIGVIAQEVEKVFPTLVQKDLHGYRRVNYDALVGLLIQAVKELQTSQEVFQAEVLRSINSNRREIEELKVKLQER